MKTAALALQVVGQAAVVALAIVVLLLEWAMPWLVAAAAGLWVYLVLQQLLAR